MGNNSEINNFIDKKLSFQSEEVKDTGIRGYMSWALIQATMPHSKPKDSHFNRKNGFFTLSMVAMYPCEIGLPYGSIPRILMAWITTEAVKTQQADIELGDSLSEFMKKLGLVPTGGRWGSITSLKMQMKRLAACAISCKYENTLNGKNSIKNIMPFDSYDWWEPTKIEQSKPLFPTVLRLSSTFFNEITNNPIAFKIDTLKLLKQSSFAIDIYFWITYRNYHAKKPFNILWENLQLQFGAGYPVTELGRKNFKRKFLETLKKVATVYPSASKLKDNGTSLLFVPGKTDAPKK